MQFNSFAFLGFFAAVALAYYAVPHRWRWVLLLVASYYFYSTFKLEYVLLLGFSTGIAFATGVVIGRCGPKHSRALLAGGILTELAALAVFKYLDFFASSFEAVLAKLGYMVALPRLGLVLPVGLSFYTFSCISYLIDVHRGKIAPERHLGRLAVYIAFFPKLLAGPIERAGPFLEELARSIRFDPATVAGGLQLMLLGLFKKVVIADRLADFVNAGFGTPAFQSPVTVLIAVYFYAFQIYCDFSGYSDLAIGAGAVLGIRLMENFRRPYFSRSVHEFWSRRWHISLMLWLRDYLYIPLGGSRVAKGRWYLNQLIVFLVSGLWHGANWTFVLWGGLNGTYQIIYSMIAAVRKTVSHIVPHRLWNGLAVLLTFHLVLIAWIFFRAETIVKAWAVITRIVSAIPLYPALLARYNWSSEFWLALGLIILLILFEAFEEVCGFWQWLALRPVVLRWGVYYAMAGVLLVFGKWGVAQFVYMQF
jgi:D-alanyl-lipoteichoic acid acyltransferase DltB (MBOAT superfamily)